jgi:putative glycosyltransferase (TIGR04372 family)
VFELFKRHCTMVETTSRVPRKLAHLKIAALRRTGNLLSTSNYREVRESMQNNPALLRFEAHEGSALAGRLEAIGIDPARRFILFGLRDMAYYRFYGDTTGTPMNKRRAATHHRCPPLATYAAAAQVWAQAGYQVIRVGLRVSEALPPGLDPRVVDYASGDRDDALDAFLFSKCWFMIAGDTGLFAGAAAFDRPSVMCDLSIVQTNIYSSNKRTPNVFVPVLFRDLQSGSLLSFREAIYHNYEFMTDEACVAMRVKLVHNSLEDLLDASRELEARLEGRYEEGPDDRERQRAFHAIYQPSHIGFRSTARVSAAFLRKYEALLDTPKGRT